RLFPDDGNGRPYQCDLQHFLHIGHRDDLKPFLHIVAMTGEITLRGRVLPIGGLKEKLLAALRTGLKTVVIPSENEKDLADIPDNVKKGLEIVPVANMEEVLKVALIRAPIPVVWEEPEEPPAARRAEDGAED